MHYRYTTVISRMQISLYIWKSITSSHWKSSILCFRAAQTGSSCSAEPFSAASGDVTGKFSDNLACFLYRCNNKLSQCTNHNQKHQLQTSIIAYSILLAKTVKVSNPNVCFSNKQCPHSCRLHTIFARHTPDIPQATIRLFFTFLCLLHLVKTHYTGRSQVGLCHKIPAYSLLAWPVMWLHVWHNSNYKFTLPYRHLSY